MGLRGYKEKKSFRIRVEYCNFALLKCGGWFYFGEEEPGP